MRNVVLAGWFIFNKSGLLFSIWTKVYNRLVVYSVIDVNIGRI